MELISGIFLGWAGYMVNIGICASVYDGDLLTWAGVPGRLFFVVSLLVPFGSVVSVSILGAIRYVLRGA